MGVWLALSGKVKTWLAVAGGVVIALFYAYIKGRTDQGKAEEAQEISDYVETRRRLDDTAIPRDADAATQEQQWHR